MPPKTALELPQHHVIVVNKFRRDNAEVFWAASAFDANDGKPFRGCEEEPPAEFATAQDAEDS